MKFKVGFTDGALIDMRNAHSWYEHKVPGFHAQRIYIKQYDLETNVQIDAHLLSESDVHTNPHEHTQTVVPTKGELTKLIEALPKKADSICWIFQATN